MSRTLRLTISIISLVGLAVVGAFSAEPQYARTMIGSDAVAGPTTPSPAATSSNLTSGNSQPAVAPDDIFQNRPPATERAVASLPARTGVGANPSASSDDRALNQSTAPPINARYLYPQHGYADGHGGVAHSDTLYEVYRLPNGAYWLKVV